MKDHAALDYEDIKWLRELVDGQDAQGPLGLTRKLAELERRLRPLNPSVVYELSRVDEKTVDVIVNMGEEHVPYQRLRERGASFLRRDVEGVRTRWLTQREIERLKYPDAAVLRVSIFDKEMKKIVTQAQNISKDDLAALAEEFGLL